MKAWQENQAIYVHIPFCVQKCLYCDFASYACCDEKAKAAYVEALCKEIRQPLQLAVSPEATIYFGGGTPSTLSIEQLRQIVQELKKQGLWQSPQEASIEVNPGTVDLTKLKSLRQLGFDRISMGVQSLNDGELRTIGRIHTGAQALEAIAMAQAAGFERINADVIYGLPGQSLASLKQTLQGLVTTAIDHISVYGLIVEEGTPLASLVEAGKLLLPSEDETADMYDFVQSFLAEQGFVRYEISNYARKLKKNTLPKLAENNIQHLDKNMNENIRQRLDKKLAENNRQQVKQATLIAETSYSRHNDVYWRYQPYAAFGASAVSFDGQARYTRPADLAEYERWVESCAKIAEPLSKEQPLAEYEKCVASCTEIAEPLSKEEPLAEYEKCVENRTSIAEPLSKEELLAEYMMMGLRRLEGADLEEAKERFGVDVMKKYAQELAPFLQQGLLSYNAKKPCLALTAKGMAVGNQIFAVFVN